MGLFSSGGGDDTLQMRLLLWGTMMSLMVSILCPILTPVTPTGYTLDEIYDQRAGLELYTGQSMINQAPFVLQHVYTPYTVGEPYRTTEEGWLYGSELVDENDDPYWVFDGENQLDGQHTVVKLDPAMKSQTPLFTGTETDITEYRTLDFLGGGFWQSVTEGVMRFVGLLRPIAAAGTDTEEWYYSIETKTYPTWNFSGYRYEFDPMLRINTENGTSTKAVDDAKLSIVWYDLDGQEGISGGLVLYNNKTNAILANYTAAEIVSGYNALRSDASLFYLNFDGILVNMWVRFDPDVVINNLDLSQAFSEGKWTIAFTCASADTYLDLQNSNSFTASLGSMIDTYIKLFTLDLPNLPLEWNLVLWILCVMPLGLAMILFLSRFGLAGVGAGILGAIFAGGALT